MGRRVDDDHDAFWARPGERPRRTLDSVVDQQPSNEEITPRGADGWAAIWADHAGSSTGDDAWAAFLSGSDDGTGVAGVDARPRWRRPFARSA